MRLHLSAADRVADKGPSSSSLY